MNVTHLFSALSGLSSVHRFSMTKMCEPESVLEHSGWVALVSCLLAREINAIDPSCVIVGDMLTRALIHDLDEIVTGDVPRPTKYRNEQTVKAFKEMSRWGVTKVIKSLDLSEEVAREMMEFHMVAKLGREGLIVAIADCMAVVYKLWEETIVRRNHSMMSHASRLSGQLEDLRRGIDEEFRRVEVKTYLLDVIDQCEVKVAKILEMDDPMFGSSVRE